MTKKIICLIESLSSGGAERQIVYLASELKKVSYDVEVWTYYHNDFYLSILHENNVPYKYFPSAANKWKRISVLRKVFFQVQPDVVIAYLETACIISCIIKAIGGNFKLIVSERNTTQKLTFREHLKFFSYRYADYIVPNSYTQGEFIKKKYTNLLHKVRVITNYIDDQKFKPKIIKKDNKYLSVIVVGRIMPQKNPITLMHAIKKLQTIGINVKVTWYGNKYNERYHKSCLDVIKELEIEQSFIFVPATPNISEEYPKYDVFCLPSIYEGFPNVLCEAMSCGLPVICSNVCDNKIIVKDTKSGYLFNPYNYEDIADKLKKIAMLSHEERLKMGNSARERIITTFTNSTFINNYIALIN